MTNTLYQPEIKIDEHWSKCQRIPKYLGEVISTEKDVCESKSKYQPHKSGG